MMNAVKEELLDYSSFVSIIKNMIKEKMGKGYDVSVCKVINKNAAELESMTVLKEGRNFAPNVYLKAYYESYLAGTPLTELADRLFMIYKHCAIPKIREGFDNSLEAVKSHIFFRLINYKRNKKYLAQIPHIRLLDIAITFHCLVRCEDDTVSTFEITNAHIKQWKITVKDLQKIAFYNTRKLFPPKLRTMDDIIDEYSGSGSKAISKGEETYPIFVLTSEKGIYGAFYLLYKDVIRDVARLKKSNLYILPISVHELILIPEDDSLKRELLKKLILEINKFIMSADEILSDNVYVYSLKYDNITLAID